MTKYENIEEKYVEKMRKINKDYRGDPEIAHGEADDLLVEFLKELGFEKLVKEYENIPKWYA